MLEIYNTLYGKCVSALELHNVLHIKTSNYNDDVKSWVNKEYLFQGEVELRKPILRYDYIPLNEAADRNNTLQDYALSLEFAKLIALDSDSIFKKQFIQWLLSLDSKIANFELLSRNLIIGLLEIAKLCTFIDNQVEFYKRHKKKFLEELKGYGENDYSKFDVWRNNLLQIGNALEIKKEYGKLCIVGNLRTKQEQLAFLDKLTSIRNALFDFLRLSLPQGMHMTRQALDLSDFTRRMMQSIGNDIQIKRKSEAVQLDLFLPIEEEFDMLLISQTIREISRKAS